jgi:hypothetical protein
MFRLKGPHAHSESPDSTGAPQCAQCNYTLIGLAHKGRCPECGRPYKIVNGALAGMRPGMESRRIRTMGAVAGTVLVLTLMGMDALGLKSPVLVLVVLAVVSLIFLRLTKSAAIRNWPTEGMTENDPRWKMWQCREFLGQAAASFLRVVGVLFCIVTVVTVIFLARACSYFASRANGPTAPLSTPVSPSKPNLPTANSP